MVARNFCFRNLRNYLLLKLSDCISFEGKIMFRTDLCAVGGTFNKFEFPALDFKFPVLAWSFVGGGWAAAAAVAAAAAGEVVVVVIVGRRFLINAGSRFSPFLILTSTVIFSFVNPTPFVSPFVSK